jgi:site-specific recombinase XerD
MLIYSGVRISELLDLQKEDVNLAEQWFHVRQSKTNAGVRVVPIADKVLAFWQVFMQQSQCDYAVCTVEGQRLTYENFKKRYWHPLMQQLNMTHTPHETRHTFISQMVIRNVNQTILKKIVGHKSIMNLTERIYTHIEIEELLGEVNKL